MQDGENIVLKFIGAYLKWAINVIIKLFFVSFAATLLMPIAALLGTDFNALFSGVSIWEIAKNYLQHIPHIGMYLDSFLQLCKATSIEIPFMETSLYGEILLLCIYMIIVRWFDAVINMTTKLFKKFTRAYDFMATGKVTAVLADATVYVATYALAFGIAGLMYDAMVKRFPANIACWVLAGALVLFSVLLAVFKKETFLTSFLKLIGGGVLDIFQLVLIYLWVMCLLIMQDANAAYLTDGEEILLAISATASLIILAISIIKRTIDAYLEK